MKKTYKVRYEKNARKTLKKMDPYEARLILLWIDKNLENTEEPQAHGKGLSGTLSN